MLKLHNPDKPTRDTLLQRAAAGRGEKALKAQKLIRLGTLMGLAKAAGKEFPEVLK